jgi:hypothetical protein
MCIHSPTRTICNVLLGALTIALPVISAHAQSKPSSSTSSSSARSTPTPARQPAASPAPAARASADRASLRAYPEVRQSAQGASAVVDHVARQSAIDAARSATNGHAQITSRDRPSSSPISSAAHDRGAVDAKTRNMNTDGLAISKAAGKGYTVIHEVPRGAHSAQGGTASAAEDLHTVYRNGKQVGQPSAKPARATGEHIHIQPDFNKGLHAAAAPPKTGQTQPVNPAAVSDRKKP